MYYLSTRGCTLYNVHFAGESIKSPVLIKHLCKYYNIRVIFTRIEDLEKLLKYSPNYGNLFILAVPHKEIFG